MKHLLEHYLKEATDEVQELVRTNMKIVPQIASTYRGARGVDFDDLVGEGYQQLVIAATKYIEDEIDIPADKYLAAAVRNRLRRMSGRRNMELDTMVGDDPVGDEGEDSLLDTLPYPDDDGDDPAEKAHHSEVSDVLDRLISGIGSDRKRKILAGIRDGKSYAAMASEFSTSRANITQQARKAIADLLKALEKEGVKSNNAGTFEAMLKKPGHLPESSLLHVINKVLG